MSNSFGKNVRKYRKMKGLTQVELADLVGYTYSMICKIETDKTSIPQSMIAKIAKVLDIPPSLFFAEENETDKVKEFLPYLAQADDITLNNIRAILGMPIKK